MRACLRAALLVRAAQAWIAWRECQPWRISARQSKEAWVAICQDLGVWPYGATLGPRGLR